MKKHPRFSSDPETGQDSIHTPGGMSEPAAEMGPAEDVADLAATDMSAEPSSRQESTQSTFREGREAGIESELESLRDKHLRLAAEFDNYRKRVNRERAELFDRGQASLMERLLEVVDDLDRLSAGAPAPEGDAILEAVCLIDRKLRKELESAGLERIDPVGQPFNPVEHEAVAVTPAPAPAQDQSVSATFQTGYRFKGALLRPARVQVYADQGRD
ncbi:MAG TPA: nucleotide exchange factor GrpE [Gemmatimonadales bacterium]|nr:nucleotide exchange factor GrpE [Gemmatimonadales bacterium]